MSINCEAILSDREHIAPESENITSGGDNVASDCENPPSEEKPASDPKWKRTKGFWPSLISICIPLLLSALEGSITNTALPTIAESLDLGTSFSWVATAFLLASTMFQPLYGQLGDMWGRKYPMIIAVIVFAIGSAIAGASNSGAVLIFGRVVQGLGKYCDSHPLKIFANHF